MTIQHLRSSTANKRPTPAVMSDGQIAVNTNTASPGLFFKDSAGALIKVGPVHVGTTAPNASPASGGETGNTVGEQWLDTAGGTYVFKVWDGSAWRSETGTFVDVNGDVMTGALGIIAGSAGAPGLYISGDANTGVFSPSADALALSTGGSERARLTASGQLLVGTSTAPAAGELLRVEKASTGTEGAGIRFAGSYTIADAGTQTFTVGNANLISISNNSTGDGALFFCDYKSATISLLSDPSSVFATAVTAGKVSLTKSANSSSITLTNNSGAQRGFTIGKINAND